MTATGAAARRPAAPAGPSPTRLGLLLGYVAGTSGLGLAAAPIVSREVAAELGVATAQTAWVVAIFSLAIGVSTPVWGRLADLHGGRRVVVLASLASVAGTIVVLLAPTMPALLAGRFLQGAASAGLSIVAFSIPAQRLDPAGRARALGVLTALAALTLGAGPVLGAAAESLAGWRAALTLSVLMLLAAPALARMAAPPMAGAGRHLDLGGASLVLATGVAAFVLLQARATGIAPVIVGLVAIAGIGAAVTLARHVRRVPTGFLPLAVVRNRVFVWLSLSAAALMAGFLGLGFVAPLLLTENVERSSLEVGMLLLPAALCAAATAQVVGMVRGSVSAEAIMVALGAVSATGVCAAGFAGDTPAVVIAGLAAATSGFAGAQVAILDRIADLVPVADRGVAMGVFNLIFITGGATGAAVAGAVVDVSSLSAAAIACGILTALAMPTAWAAARSGT
ncbi:MAG: MFS transporter [Solirubrobacteraceae bacterium]|nr:MFS transporter [Solirubrobacteraceae bacterium]